MRPCLRFVALALSVASSITSVRAAEVPLTSVPSFTLTVPNYANVKPAANLRRGR
jgi:hypothetical protein